ncbi:MAG: Hsp33 family molecular chaperone HslO [Lachnospiraceae bacterium]|nr:Hsp33 family molecular chaperone HslO [Lachnospiraceae bacterium]
MEKEYKSNDYIVRMTAAGLQLRAFAISSGDMCEFARSCHGTSPVATAALGRLLTAGAMMGSMQKNAADMLTLQIRCDGPIGGLTVTADGKGHVKGYVNNPVFEGYARADHKLDVGGALGYGTLTVIRDLGLKEPFAGTSELVTGEIAEDLTYYFATSEQIPSAVGLGVLLKKETGEVKCAGGFIIQAMPEASDETLTRLEQNLAGVTSVTDLLDRGMSPEQILEQILEGLDPKTEQRSESVFYCDCSRKKIAKVLYSLNEKDLAELMEEDRDVEVKCHFCNSAYQFSPDTIREIYEERKKDR